ncbi:transposase family protein [Streptomyces sp. NPDC005349]|uniref:transposase family protein n=1 Tax=Streptomyces sp. NPDC005349 TaxID=3157037 RepID=UPI0033ACBD85
MVACPDCGRESARVHSRYPRTLADVAVGGRPVLISLTVRRLSCGGPDCGRRTFAEQVEGLTVRYQRRSPLLQHLVELAGVLLAGRGGARLLHILKVPLSRTSVLFQVMRVPLPSVATPRVLGVDDFALYADVYGTLLVDADTRLPSSWPPGCARTPASRWCAGTARWSIGRASPTVPRTQCRSATVFTSGRGCRNGSRTSPRPTADACPPQYLNPNRPHHHRRQTCPRRLILSPAATPSGCSRRCTLSPAPAARSAP